MSGRGFPTQLSAKRQTMIAPSSRKTFAPRQMRAVARAAALIAVAASLAACSRHREVTGSIRAPDDYRERHPIIIANAPRNLEIYPMRGSQGLDQRQADDLAAFAAEYKSQGRGYVTVALPEGGGESHVTLAGIRRVLASAGVSPGYLNITYYRSDDPATVAPVRLSFKKLQAKVDSFCGQWTNDFNGAGTSEAFRNQSPPNFGCAYQSAIAAQVANPIDLVRPRQEGPIDVLKRSKDIEDLRQHKDPSTEWKVNAQTTGSTGQ